MPQSADFELLYTTSRPGRLVVLDAAGRVRGQWDASDHKLGNSPVVIDADGDGHSEAIFGSRTNYLVRLDMTRLKLLRRRSGWVQCGCHTSAMDVDGDGRWDLFAGAGDDHRSKGKLLRFDPVSLETVWQFETNDNASSADPVLDGTGRQRKRRDGRRGDARVRPRRPRGTSVTANLLDASRRLLIRNVESGVRLDVEQPVFLEFVLETTDPRVTPLLDHYRLSFDR